MIALKNQRFCTKVDWDADHRTTDLSHRGLVDSSQHTCLQGWFTTSDVNGDCWCYVGTCKNRQPRTSAERENIDYVDLYPKVHLEFIITDYYGHLVYTWSKASGNTWKRSHINLCEPRLLDSGWMVPSLVLQVQHAIENYARTYTHTITHALWWRTSWGMECAN